MARKSKMESEFFSGEELTTQQFIDFYCEKNKETCIKVNKGHKERVSTGSLQLDKILGGGIPLRYITQIFGPELSGKTTMMYHILADAQRQGYDPAFIDTELKYDYVYASQIGVDTSKVTPISFSILEELFDFINLLLDHTKSKVILIDSIAAPMARAFIKKQAEKVAGKEVADNTPQIGSYAKAIQYGLDIIRNKLYDKDAALIMTNQTRTVITPTYTKLEPMGGRALQYYSSIKIKTFITGSSSIEDKIRNMFGVHTSVTVPKCQVPGVHQGTAELDIYQGYGIDQESELLNIALGIGAVEQSGSWLKYGKNFRAQGRPTFISELKKQGMFDTFKTEVLTMYNDIPVTPIEMDNEDIDDTILIDDIEEEENLNDA